MADRAAARFVAYLTAPSGWPRWLVWFVTFAVTLRAFNIVTDWLQ